MDVQPHSRPVTVSQNTQSSHLQILRIMEFHQLFRKILITLFLWQINSSQSASFDLPTRNGSDDTHVQRMGRQSPVFRLLANVALARWIGYGHRRPPVFPNRPIYPYRPPFPTRPNKVPTIPTVHDARPTGHTIEEFWLTLHSIKCVCPSVGECTCHAHKAHDGKQHASHIFYLYQ